jgi:hypothetical protein
MLGNASLFQGEWELKFLTFELVLDQGLSSSYRFSCTSLDSRAGGGTGYAILRYPVQYCNFVHYTCTAASSNDLYCFIFLLAVVLLQLAVCTLVLNAGVVAFLLEVLP